MVKIATSSHKEILQEIWNILKITENVYAGHIQFIYDIHNSSDEFHLHSEISQNTATI